MKAWFWRREDLEVNRKMSKSKLCNSETSQSAATAMTAMATIRKPTTSMTREMEIKKQMQIYRENLHCVCRLAIRTMVEKASCEGVDDSCFEFKNLATILEHILSHRLKGQITWFGLEGPKDFWDFIAAACSSLPHNCIKTIGGMEDAKTHRAKGRAWIRAALMEKRLAEYMSHATANTRAIKAFYSESAFMRSDKCKEIVQELVKLNTVDFSCCLKGKQLDTRVASVIDYSQYLKLQLRNYEEEEAWHLHQPITIATLTSQTCSQSAENIQQADQSTESRFKRLQSQFKIVCAQKNYLEEMVAHKEKGNADAMQEIQRYQQTIRLLEQQARQDRKCWERLVIDLHDQITTLKEAQMVSRRDLEQHLINGHWEPPSMNSVGTYTGPGIALENLETMMAEVAPDRECIQTGEDPSLGGTASAGSPVSSLTSSIRTDDQQSEDHHTSASVQVTKPLDKEPTPSLVPLAGSFTSEVSLRSTETSWPGIASASDTHSINTQGYGLLQDADSVSYESRLSDVERSSLSINT